VDAHFPLQRDKQHYFGEVAKRYRYADGQGEVGVIASVTQAFCGSCTRLRLSPDGKLYTCLFATNGLDIFTPLREGASDDDLTALIATLWQNRTDRYSEERGRASLTTVLTALRCTILVAKQTLICPVLLCYDDAPLIIHV
jgi:cyclic pyranopterin phosphate synthase